MKRRLQHIILMGAALLLCAVTLWSTVLATTGQAADPLDYGKNGMGSNETLNALPLFERVFGQASDADERAYLDGLCEISLTYNSAIPDSIISTYYDADHGTLDVSLKAYTFTASNGTTVAWIPTRAHIKNRTQTFALSDQTYSCRFDQLQEIGTGNFEMQVDFAWQTELPEDAADALLNAAYNEGSEALESILDYEAEYALYRGELERYQAYQAYLEAVEKYDAYLVAVEKYESDKVEYDAYKKVYDEYAATLEAYNAWRHYYAYQSFLKNDLENYNAYLTYQAQVEKVVKKLSVLEALFVKDSHGWQLYGSLMGNTVSTVVERKNELITAGCSEKDINAAGEATVALRELMKEYADLREAEYATEHERLTALYAYYTANYTAIRDQFAKLYGALKALHGNSIVVVNLNAEGKLEHYRQFVGQLYITTICLDDNMTWLPKWEMGGKTIDALVEPVQMMTDYNSAAPGDVKMPETEVLAVEKVEPIEEPTVPDPGIQPIAPSPVVAEPIKPDAVADPDQGVIPPEADEPRPEPTAPKLDDRIRALAEDVRANRLKKREVTAYSRTLEIEKTVKRLVTIDNRKTVTFLSEDGTEILDQQVLEYGSPVYYRGESTDRESDAQYSYVFLGWIQADGTASDMIADKDLTLYANYHRSLRRYSVTWVLDGNTETVYNVPYGETPVCPFEVERETDVGYTYAFSGWFKDGAAQPAEVTPVTGNVTYTGSIKATPRIYTVTWNLGDRTVEEQLPYGTDPVFHGVPSRSPDAYRYTFLSWNQALHAVSGDVTYTARYEKKALATAEDGSAVDVMHTDSAVTVFCTATKTDIYEAVKLAQESGKRLVLRFEQFAVNLDAAGMERLLASSARQIKLTVTQQDTYGTVYSFGYCNSYGDALKNLSVPATICAVADENGNARAGYLAQGEEWLALGADEAEVSGSATFRVCNVYRINVNPVGKCDLSTLPRTFSAGSLVRLNLDCTFGYEVSAAQVTLSDGTEVPVDQLTFLMPQGDVTVTLTVTQIVYRVTFVSDGKVISQADYLLGEQIAIPADPYKESDGVYDYVFSGWSMDATLAMGDDRNPIYEAVYTATPIPASDPYQSGNNNNVFITVVLPIVGCVLLLGSAALIVWRVLKKRKRAVPPETVKKQPTEQPSEPIDDAPVTSDTDEPALEPIPTVADEMKEE